MLYIIILLCGLLGAWGGAENTSKAWRRIGIPIVLCLCAYFKVGLYCLSALLLFAPLCIGYGRFDPQDESPSTLGLWAFRTFPKSAMKQDVLIRLSVSFLCVVSLVPYMIKTAEWWHSVVFGLFYMAISVVFGAIVKKEGMIKVFGKDLLVEEFLIFSALGTMILI